MKGSCLFTEIEKSVGGRGLGCGAKEGSQVQSWSKLVVLLGIQVDITRYNWIFMTLNFREDAHTRDINIGLARA